MLKKFTVSNYRSFEKPITLDFTKVGEYDFNVDCVKDGLINKAIIYGKNAVGKTNLGLAIVDVMTMISDILSDGVLRQSRSMAAGYINSNSSYEVAKFEYVFQLDGSEIIYIYEKYAVDKMHSESLTINSELLYDLNFADKKVNFSNEFAHLNLENLNDHIPVLRYILNNTILKESHILKRFENFIKGMRNPESLSDQLDSSIRTSMHIDCVIKEQHVSKLEDFLQEMGVDIKLIVITMLGKKELYIHYGKEKAPLPFVEYASNGTLSLVDLYPYAEIFKTSTFMYMDEFDANFHFKAAKSMFEKFKKNSNCQTIITTHNTDIMSNKYLRPDCYLLMFPDKIISLMDATDRKLRRGHNLEKLYQSGEFEELLDRIGDDDE